MLFVFCGLLYISSTTAAGLTKEQFIQALLQPIDTQAQVELSPQAKANAEAQRQRNTQRYYEMVQRQANAVELSQDEIQLRTSRLEQAKQQEQVYSPDMTVQQTTPADTFTNNAASSGDDEHTKALKRRAVIALAVFLPILVLTFLAFFVFIFFFSTGSSSAKTQNPSKSHKSSTNNSNTQKTDRDNRDESSTGGSRTRNQISTTM